MLSPEKAFKLNQKVAFQICAFQMEDPESHQRADTEMTEGREKHQEETLELRAFYKEKKQCRDKSIKKTSDNLDNPKLAEGDRLSSTQ